MSGFHLFELNKIPKDDLLYVFSNPKIVLKKAKEYLGNNVIIFKSIRPNKKYMVYNPETEKFVYFGAMKYEDFTKHKDEERRENYLKRSSNIKGDWKDNKYSPNNLSRNILW